MLSIWKNGELGDGLAKGRHGSQIMHLCDLGQLVAPLCASSLIWEERQCQCCFTELAREPDLSLLILTTKQFL